MGENTAIEWADHTFNAWIGCEVVSPACDHCYARTGSARIGARYGLQLWGGDRFFTGEDYWRQPIRWNRAAEAVGRRARVFTNSFGDVFEDRPDLVPRRAMLAELVDKTPWLDWLLLTKRPEHAERLWYDARRIAMINGVDWGHNVLVGTTVEDVQRKARIEVLRTVPARRRFLSAEPLLEDLGDLDLTGIHQVIVGGESGARARPMELEWAESIAKQCVDARVAFFMKQLGATAMHDGRLLTLRNKKGNDMAEWPESLRVRQFPEVRA